MVQTIQCRADFRRRHSIWYTAYCMVKLDDTSTRVKMPARRVSSSVPAGGHGPTVFARMVKKAAKSPLKNISSDPSQIMTPDGQHRRPVVDDLPLGRGDLRRDSLGHRAFLADRARETPTNRSAARRSPLRTGRMPRSAAGPRGAARRARP